jgi:hypothetical protein
MEENRIPKRVLYMNLETSLKGRPRNRWQDEVREDGRTVGGEEWQENYITERNGRIACNRNIFWGGKGGRCVGLTTLPPSCADCLKNLGASTSCNSQGLSRPLMV